MTHDDPYSASGHPTEEALFLFTESELAKNGEEERIRDHVAACWDCRARIEALQEAMMAYVSYKHQVLESAAPPPPSRWLRFAPRLRDVAQASTPPSFAERFRAAFRLPLAATLACLIAGGGGCLWFFLRVQVVSAKETLFRAQNAEAATLTVFPQPVVHQRVRLSSGPASAEGEFWRFPVNHQVRSHWIGDDSVVSGLAGVYRSAQLELEAPLSPSNVAKWREYGRQTRDRVEREPSGRYLRIVSTAPLEDASQPILEVGLTLRSSDLHPVAEELRVRGANGEPVEYKLVEIAFEVVPFDSLAVSVFGEPGGASAVTGRPSPTASLPVPGLSAGVLAESEARLHEIMHAAGADTREAPEIWVDGSHVYYYLWADDPQRHEEIVQAVSVVPYVVESDQPPEPAAPRIGPSLPTQLFTITPPLAQALEYSLGGLDAANSYLNRIRDAYLLALAEISALDRLGRRYSEGDVAALPLDARARIDGIAADHLARIRAEINQYLGLISPVLDEMLSKNNAAAASHETLAEACTSWQKASPRMVEELRRLQRSFGRLFVKDQAEAPVDPSAGALLAEAAANRTQLETDLKTTCSVK